jgi:hypothetical protein
MEAGSDRRESLNSNQDDGFRSATRSNNRKRSEFQANQGSRDWNYECSVGSKIGHTKPREISADRFGMRSHRLRIGLMQIISW